MVFSYSMSDTWVLSDKASCIIYLLSRSCIKLEIVYNMVSFPSFVKVFKGGQLPKVNIPQGKVTLVSLANNVQR